MVLLDASRRRALWVRETILIPRQGDGRATIWGAWFDADAPVPAHAAKRYMPIEQAKIGEGEELINIDGAWMSRTAAKGGVETLSWDFAWGAGRDTHSEVPSWLPVPTHAKSIAYDADASGTVTVGGRTLPLQGRATAMHLWGKRRVPTLQWIWAPWIGDGSLAVQAVSFQDTFSLGLATLRLDGPDLGEARMQPTSLRGRPATAAHPNCLVSATVAGPRRLIHARAWAEPREMVGYAYRDTDDRDVMVAQSDIGSAHLEVYSRTAPGAPWHVIDERRAAGGVAVEIHQHARLPEVEYIAWDDTSRSEGTPITTTPLAADHIEWPKVNDIVALGLTYGDHIRETGRKLAPNEPPTSFTKHVRTFAPGALTVRVPDTQEILAALEEVEPGLAAIVRDKLPIPLPVMDYEGEIALVALDTIDDAKLSAGVAQPLGLAAANDLTARICQVLGENTESSLAYWSCAKSFPRFLPLASHVWAPPGGLATMPEITIETKVNGDVRQRASTKLLIYDLAAMVRAACAHLGRPLERGDIILTGTPSGVGLRLSPLKRRVAAMIKDRFRKAKLLVSTYATSNALLRPGDVVEVDAGPAGRVKTRLTL
ncbi:MAG: fumarylacetoacetate hydrolase family protein [Myxococcota bacterium]|nr:fumarylacetoacetate hydrolase family protein [Myxococcota bacterium]